MSEAQYVAVQSRGTIALPIDIRRRNHLDQPGAQVEVVERRDGIIELHPHVAVPADQAWFWSKRWQEGERQVDRHIERGELREYAGPDELFDYLEGKANE